MAKYPKENRYGFEPSQKYPRRYCSPFSSDESIFICNYSATTGVWDSPGAVADAGDGAEEGDKLLRMLYLVERVGLCSRSGGAEWTRASSSRARR